jgi:hypothetical protein
MTRTTTATDVRDARKETTVGVHVIDVDDQADAAGGH